MEPKCIVLDEPTAMLDPNGRKGSSTYSGRSYAEQKKVTVILITHYMEEVVDADKVLCYGSRACGDGRNTEGNLFSGGYIEELSDWMFRR